MELLQLSGIQILASDLKGEKKIQELDLTMPTAFVVGSEDEGVSPHLLRRADQHFIIPQIGTTDSFNVSVAAGIMLYEVIRQRG
jgi:23S rRNA (guanosine2251-2'-O)-methyltransferase